MSLPERVGVVGGGRMGAGIAHAFLVAGSHVTVLEADSALVGPAVERVNRSLRASAERGALSCPAEAIATRFAVTVEDRQLAACDLVVEAVPEDLDLKRTVLRRIEGLCPHADLATNTSSLSVGGIATALKQPERLVGLHFFNPVPASELVEVVVGPRTSGELTKRAGDWVEGLGKTGITVTDSPGFASSRLGVAIALEAMRMVEDGVASAADIDTAMTLGYRHPVGPLRTTDIVGLDVRLAIAEHLEREVGPRFAPPEILRRKVAAGEFGRKTNRGFFDW
ncbi:3-hydroxyacyl-CoA dehydrogenase family protein [Saccharomonospora sp. NPDC046836]|uniref:3-hydroxyacyl-CoA dehydrogenase family protein n=1 Tax=Saccharomonospora sp. NPDC046836 TaxID=3156921 RepID=UPI0033E59DAA